MLSVASCPIPDGALPAGYLGEGTCTDCYMTEVPGAVSLAQYVLAFYTTRVLKLERLILKVAAARPSTGAQARQLAEGAIDTFAAWYEEVRDENQLLLSDIRRRHRSWLMAVPKAGTGAVRTRLYLGSAVVPVENPRTGRLEPGFGFRALLGLHRLYPRLLLHAAGSRLIPGAETGNRGQTRN
jgi:hypothetical protein